MHRVIIPLQSQLFFLAINNWYECKILDVMNRYLINTVKILTVIFLIFFIILIIPILMELIQNIFLWVFLLIVSAISKLFD